MAMPSKDTVRWYIIGPGAITWALRSVIRTLRRFWQTTDPKGDA